MSSELNQEFGSIRSILWPIHKHEAKKFVPMLIMIGLIVFCYDLLRNMKDTVVITAAGAEVIPFIKVWVMFPAALLSTVIFTKLTNIYSQEKVFYIVITTFLTFFALFGFVLYPMRHALHLDSLSQFLEQVLPLGFKGFISMVRYWSFALFYAMAELWQSIVMSVLFWGFANEVTRIGEARRFFGVFCFGANCCAILAGQASRILPEETIKHPDMIREDWAVPVMILIALVTLCGLITMGVFYWMNRQVLNDPAFDELHSTKKAQKAKGKLSLKESVSYLSNSKYLLCIALIVLAYNLVINLIEVVWKDQLRRLYPSPDDYFLFMGNLTSAIGVLSAITSLCLAYIVNRFGWTKTALITPIIILFTGSGFFLFLFYQKYIGETTFILGMSPLWLAVMFGGAQNCLSKAMKYSVFDATKEMAFIPLSHECKLKGKAAIDGVGSRMGKSCGALIHASLLTICGSLSNSAPYVAALIVTMIGFWIYAAKSLGRQFSELTNGKLVLEATSATATNSSPDAAPLKV